MQKTHQKISKWTRIQLHSGLKMTNLTRIMNLNISSNLSLFNLTDEGLLMPENTNEEEEEGGKIKSLRSLNQS